MIVQFLTQNFVTVYFLMSRFLALQLRSTNTITISYQHNNHITTGQLLEFGKNFFGIVYLKLGIIV